MTQETVEQIRTALKQVIDPELNLSIIDLGLVYEISFHEGQAFIKMTLTSPFCPVGPQILSETKRVAQTVPEVKIAHVQLTFTPAWSPEKATDEIKAMFEQMM